MRTRHLMFRLQIAFSLFLCLFSILCVCTAHAQSTQGIAFRRMSDPVQLAVGPAAQPTMIPPNVLKDPVSGQPVTTFYVVNPNQVYVRAKGFSNAADCQNVGVTSSTGWLWPPGFVGVFSTQFPICASVMAVPMPGYPLTGSYAPLEWSYGLGAQ